ncbi:MAG: hypothetical protein HZA80_02935 [Candidatus Taylorbacteria bacterium]|nr:hypothetical protein [Candidatus Taylorbacteria bacterium]
MKDRLLFFGIGWVIRPIFIGMVLLSILMIPSFLTFNMSWLPTSEVLFLITYFMICWIIGMFTLMCLTLGKILKDLWDCMDILP